MRARTGWLLLVALAALALFAAACSSGDDPTDPTATPTEDPTAPPTATPTTTPSDDDSVADPTATPVVITDDDSDDADTGGDSDSPSYASPPPVSASVDGSTVALGIGSYCWTQPGGPGLCADSIGPITGPVPLTVQRGDVIELSSTLDLANAEEIIAQLRSEPGAPIGTGPEWLAWSPTGERTPIEIERTSGGLRFSADFEPGLYVVSFFVGISPWGDASYGLLLEVGASHPDASAGGVALGESVELAPGVSVAIPGEEATLTFVAVSGDSRCPSDAVCVWAGEAHVAFSLEAAGDSKMRAVAVPPDGAASLALGSYRLTVLDLRPEATTAGPIPQSEYRATIVLDLLPPRPAPTGVQGLVSIGPQCPVQRSDQPCPDLPLEATLVLQDASGAEVARTTSSPDGLYRIAASPGSYILVPQPFGGSPLPFAGPLEVTIGIDGWTTLDVAYDSGIR